MSGEELLLTVLEEARLLGFLGPGPVVDHVGHARGFLAALDGSTAVERAVDLGSGGGVPGLVLALARPDTAWTLVDAQQRRTAHLRHAVEVLGLGERVDVVTARAEELGRVRGVRGGADLVVARSFAPPAVTAECAAPLLRPGGVLVVSEPPADESSRARWDGAGLAALGMGEDATISGPPRVVRLRQVERCPERYPRRVGVPAKRPLW